MARGTQPTPWAAMRLRRLRAAALLGAVAAAVVAWAGSSRHESALSRAFAFGLPSPRALVRRRHELMLRRAAAAEEAQAEPELIEISMDKPLDGRVGVRIQGGRRTVSSLVHEQAFSLGWRVGDVITQVNGEEVLNNEAVKAAVKKALAAYQESGTPLRFVVKRRLQKMEDKTRSMLRMTPGTGGGTTVPMKDLLQNLVMDFPVVMIIDGKLSLPNSNMCARAIKVLNEAGVAYKAIDAVDEKYNPGVREAVEELAGEWTLPQLWIGGKHVGNAYTMEDMANNGTLLTALRMGGANDFEPTPKATVN